MIGTQGPAVPGRKMGFTLNVIIPIWFVLSFMIYVPAIYLHHCLELEYSGHNRLQN
jgi:hypothetical protein